MLTKASYIVEMAAINIDEFIAATGALVDTIECSIAYKPHDNGEWYEVVVTCYDNDLWLVEIMLAPFV